MSSQGCDTCPQPLLGASRAPGAPKMRVLPIAKTLSRMQSCFAVFWMQSMHIFGLLRISIMDGWRRKADGSECREAGCRNFLNCELFPGRRAAMPSNNQLQPESIGYIGGIDTATKSELPNLQPSTRQVLRTIPTSWYPTKEQIKKGTLKKKSPQPISLQHFWHR